MEQRHRRSAVMSVARPLRARRAGCRIRALKAEAFLSCLDVGRGFDSRIHHAWTIGRNSASQAESVDIYSKGGRESNCSPFIARASSNHRGAFAGGEGGSSAAGAGFGAGGLPTTLLAVSHAQIASIE